MRVLTTEFQSCLLRSVESLEDNSLPPPGNSVPPNPNSSLPAKVVVGASARGFGSVVLRARQFGKVYFDLRGGVFRY